MTEQEINIAIADSIPDTIAKWYCENCGWVDGLTITHDEYHETCGSLATITPSYTTDLNAMHKAEVSTILSKGLGKTFSGHLYDIINSEPVAKIGYEYDDLISGEEVASLRIHATAAQRAEAFLKTLNLWKD